MAVDVYRLHHYLLLLGYDACDVVHNAKVVVANDAQGDVVLRLSLAAPSCLYYAVAEAFARFGGVGAVLTVNLYAARYGYKAFVIFGLTSL